MNTGDKASKGLVTHSICPDCADNLDFQLGVSLKTYLDSIKIPIVALNGNGSLIGVNRAATTAYKGKAVIEAVSWQEKIFECAHARLPQGCKKRVHCSGCAIRIVTSDAFSSGQSIRDIPAHLDHCSSENNEEVELFISADKIDNIIFLRIVKI